MVTHAAIQTALRATLSAAVTSTSIAWENVRFTPRVGQPYLEEQYLPGPEALQNDGPAGLLELRPMYVVRIHTPANAGLTADATLAQAIRSAFAPGTAVALSAPDTLTVRDDVAPFVSQRQPSAKPGWSFRSITIPLSVRTYSVPS